MTNDDSFREQEIIKSSEQKNSFNKELKIVRTFNAPKELLYKAFIDPEYLGRWWGSYYCQKAVCQLDPEVGGKILIQMTMANGMDVLLKGEFYELVENKRLVFTTGTVENSTGNLDIVNLNTVEFEENNGKTNLILKVKMIKSPVERFESAFNGMIKGWPESISKLEELINQII